MSFETVPSTPQPPSASWTQLLFWPALISLLAFHACANLAWQRLDNRPVRTDEEVHMIAARQYYEAFTAPQYAGLLNRVAAVTNVVPGNPMHPPLLHVAGALMIMIFGYSTDVLALTSTLFFLFLLLGCFAVLRTFLRPWEALFCVAIASLTPLTFGASRYFMTDFASAALVIWAVYALIKTDYFRNVYWVFLFALLNGLNILTRTNNFLFYLLPCLILVAGGLVLALRASAWPNRRTALGNWLLHCLLTGVVSVAVFGPWYFHHLGTLYQFWNYDHLGGQGGPFVAAMEAPAASPLEPSADELRAYAAVPPSADLALAGAPNPAVMGAAVLHAAQAQLGPKLKNLLEPRVMWRRYPIHMINNAMFLPLFSLSFLGLLCGLVLPRFRNLPVLTLLLTVLGSWALLTVVFKYDNPRYAVPVVPVLSLFAGLCVLALPSLLLRRVAAGVLLLFLLLQFLHMSFFRLPVPDQAQLALRIEPPESRFKDLGTVVYKDHLIISDAFSPVGRPTAQNFKEAVFEIMVEAEHRQPFVSGEYANFQRLNVRGLELEQAHYWPEPNPFSVSDMPGGAPPKRKLRSIGLGFQPEVLLPRLGETAYVVYAVESSDAQRETEWQHFFTSRDFTLIGRVAFPAYGMLPPLTYGVLMRKPEGELVRVANTQDIDQLHLYDLHSFIESTDFPQLDQALQEYAVQRREALVGQFQLFPMNTSISLVTMSVGKPEPAWFEMTFFFKVTAPITENWRVYFFGAPQDSAALPQEFRATGRQEWNFLPVPPTRDWQPGGYVLLKQRFQAVPVPYNFAVGFYQPPSKTFGVPAPTTVDLSQLRD